MLKKQLNGVSLLGNRIVLTNIALVANAFIWYYVVLAFLQDTLGKILLINSTTSILIWGVHFFGLIISALVGALLAKKIERRKLLIIWMMLGVISSLTLFAVASSNVAVTSLIGFLLGVSLGFGMPSCMSQYTDSIPVESRGRISGITLFASGIGIAAFSITSSTDLLLLGILLAVFRASSLIILLLTKSSGKTESKKKVSSYRSIVSQKPFILYFVPWLIFSLINYLVAPATPNIGSEDTGNIAFIQTAFMGLFAVIGGFFLDSVGRKRIAVLGFTLLGLGTAVFGISSTSLPILYFNAVIDGIAWGFLLVLFILTIWGDLSQDSTSEKYYAIGVAPFFVSKFLELTIGNSIVTNLNNPSALFSFGAFFLFLAVLPLVYAPETLSEKAMKDRNLKSYTEKALKQAQKEAGKSKKKDSDKAEETPEDEEARKLAEKYY